MEALKLRFADDTRSELPLEMGMHGIGRVTDHVGERVGLLDDAEPAAVHLCVDRRGVWLTVAEGTRGVHVNGREIRRLSMLRVGDAIHVDGDELRLVSSPPKAPGGLLETTGDAGGDPRVVLRGVGGQYHGRSFTLQRPRLVGSSADADIRIDDPAFADRHARLELIGEDIVLRDLGSVEGSLVNGEPMRDALLRTGDQIVFDAHHRFVIEAPARAQPRTRDTDAPTGQASPTRGPPADPQPSARRLPWLLLAAAVIAALLALLLLFGAG